MGGSLHLSVIYGSVSLLHCPHRGAATRSRSHPEGQGLKVKVTGEGLGHLDARFCHGQNEEAWRHSLCGLPLMLAPKGVVVVGL